MSAWLDQYKKQLDAIITTKQTSVAQVGSAPLADGFRAIQQMRVGMKANDPNQYTEDDLSSGLGKDLKKVLSGTLWAIDKAERPFYGVANVLKQQTEDGKKHDGPINDLGDVTGVNFLKTLFTTDAFAKGFTGEEKSTGKDIVDAGVGHDSGKLGAVAGFGVDMLVDPLNLVGAGQVKSAVKLAKGLKGGKKAAANAVEDMAPEAVAKLPFTPAKPAIVPGKTVPGKEGILPEPIPKIPPAFATSLPKGQVLHAGPEGIVPTPAPKAITEVPSKIGKFDPPVPNPTVTGARESVSAFEEMLAKVPTRRYGKDVKIARPFAKIVDKVRVPGERTVSKETAYKTLIETPNATVRVKTVGGKIVKRRVSTLLKKASANPESAARLETFLQKEATRISEASPKTRGSYKTSTSFKAMSRPEKTKWLKDHEHVHPDDMKTLRALRVGRASMEKWDDAVGKVLGSKSDETYYDVDQLMNAIESGKVEADDVKHIMDAVGAKSVRGIRSGANKLYKNLADTDIKDWKTATKTVDNSHWDTGARSAEVAAAREAAGDMLPEPFSIKPAENIVREVVEDGNAGSLVSPKEVLDDVQMKDLAAGLQYAVKREILDPDNAALYPYMTDKGTRRSASKKNEGTGRNFEDWNKGSQYTVVKGLMKKAGNDIGAALEGVKNPTGAYADAMFARVMPVMRTIDKVLIENGIEPILGVSEKYAVSLTNVLDTMPESFVKKHFFNMTGAGEHIPPTMWNDIGIKLMDHSRGLLTDEETASAIGHILTTEQVMRSGKTLRSGVKPSSIVGVVNEFMKAGPAIREIHETNMAHLVATDLEGAAKVTTETMRKFGDMISSPTFTPWDLPGMALMSGKVMSDTAKEMGVTSSRALTMAKEDIMIKSAAIMPPDVVAIARDAKAVSGATTRVGAVKALGRSMDNAEAGARNIMEEAGIPLTDPELLIEHSFLWKIAKSFAPHLGNAELRPLFLDRNSAGQAISKTFSMKLSKVALNHSKEDIAAAWTSLQNGIEAVNPTVAAAQAELRPAVEMLFNPDDSMSILRAAGVSEREVNRFFRKYGIPDKLKFGDDFGNDWRSWTTNDALDTLSRVQAATMAAVTHANIGADLSRKFGQAAGGKGLVKLTESKGSILGNLIDTSKYYPKEIAQQMGVLDKAMKEAAAPNKDGAFLRFLDNVMHKYKTGLTIYRPGHHFRNEVGDVFLMYADGIKDPRVMGKAFKVMSANKGRYDDWDAIRSLMVDEVIPAAGKASDPVTYTRLRGKKVPLTAAEINDAAFRHGLLPDFSTLEDINTTVAGVGKGRIGLPGKAHGKIHNVAAGASQWRDHHVRLAHMIGLLEQGSFKNIDEAMTEVSHRVRKWHPDGSDLTGVERSVMRRSFLFYSWIRKTIPLVIETAAMHPGRVMMAPKASYALAEANGIDLDGFAEPFPADQLFPGFLTDSVTGPQFGNANSGYWGINPGIPSVDIANDYASSPGGTLGTVLGSVNPLVKIPFEVGAGLGNPNAVAVDARTGIPQSDLSDYVDRQLPGVNVASNLLNRSASSGFTQRTGESASDTPEQAMNAAEANPGMDKTGFINWLTGAGLMDMSKPGYIKQARREQRNATGSR